MSQPSWDMDEGSSGGSDPHSPQLSEREALLRANSTLELRLMEYQGHMNKLNLDYLSVLKKVNDLQIKLNDQGKQLSGYEALKEELGEKTSRIGMQNDEIRTLKETICKLESRHLNKGDKHDSESDITLEEDTNSDEDAYLEVRSTKKRRKRKSQRGSNQENAKVKKIVSRHGTPGRCETSKLFCTSYMHRRTDYDRN